MASSSKPVAVNHMALDRLRSDHQTDSNRSLANKQQIKPLLRILVGEVFRRNWLKKIWHYTNNKSLRMLRIVSCKIKVPLRIVVRSSRILGAR
jgi:hypothetical protein